MNSHESCAASRTHGLVEGLALEIGHAEHICGLDWQRAAESMHLFEEDAPLERQSVY